MCPLQARREMAGSPPSSARYPSLAAPATLFSMQGSLFPDHAETDPTMVREQDHADERTRQQQARATLENRRQLAREAVLRAVGETRFAALERQYRSELFVLLDEMAFWERQQEKTEKRGRGKAQRP